MKALWLSFCEFTLAAFGCGHEPVGAIHIPDPHDTFNSPWEKIYD